MNEHDAPDEVLMRQAAGNAQRVLDYLAQAGASVPAEKRAGVYNVSHELGQAIASLEELKRLLNKECSQ